MHAGTLNQAAETTDRPWSLRMAASALSRYAAAPGHWHYKDGLLFKGIYHLWEHTGDRRYEQAVAAYVDRLVSPAGEIQGYAEADYNLDQINPAKLLFPRYRATGQAGYRLALERLRDQLRRQPRTKAGGFWHKQIYPFQMWLDGIYMASPFLAEYAVTFGEPAALDDTARQIILLERQTRDPRLGLLYHAWDESRQQRWADPVTGCSPHFWSRAIGWYGMALVDVLDFFPPGHAARPEFIAILRRTLSALAGWQDAGTGLWWQVVDQGERPGNYLEASGTCMHIYALAKGVRCHYLDQAWLAMATRAFQGLLEHLVTVDAQGHVNLNGICATAGLGGSPYRDGSFEYYVSEPIATNDLHGVGAFILAAVELERATAAAATD